MGWTILFQQGPFFKCSLEWYNKLEDHSGDTDLLKKTRLTRLRLLSEICSALKTQPAEDSQHVQRNKLIQTLNVNIILWVGNGTKKRTKQSSTDYMGQENQGTQ